MSENISAHGHLENLPQITLMPSFQKKAPKLLACGMTEAEAIARAQAGDEASFEILYHLHKRRVYSLCLRMTRDCSRAEDMTQEAFLQLYRKIGSFRGESAFATWLHRLTVNIVLMTFRKKGLPEVSFEESQESQSDNAPARELGAVDEVLHGCLDRITLERVIAELPPGYRIVFLLHDVEGYEHNEIAEILGCSIGNSKSQLHKARIKLLGLLQMIPRADTTEWSKAA